MEGFTPYKLGRLPKSSTRRILLIQRESIFVAGENVGIIRKDDFTGMLAFSPAQPPSKLTDREYSDIDELKAAVMKAYKGVQSDECS